MLVQGLILDSISMGALFMSGMRAVFTFGTQFGTQFCIGPIALVYEGNVAVFPINETGIGPGGPESDET